MKGASGESKGSRRYDKENLLWQFTVAIKSDPVGSAKEAQVAVAALQASAQGEGCSGMNADTAYTVNLIQKGLTLLTTLLTFGNRIARIISKHEEYR